MRVHLAFTCSWNPTDDQSHRAESQDNDFNFFKYKNGRDEGHRNLTEVVGCGERERSVCMGNFLMGKGRKVPPKWVKLALVNIIVILLYSNG